MVHRRLIERGVLAGLVLEDLVPDEPSLADSLLVCATELTTDAEIALFASALATELAGSEVAASPSSASPSVAVEAAR